MNASIRIFLTAVVALALSLFLCPAQRAQAQCAFVNGNFETGNLTGWTLYTRAQSSGTNTGWFNYTGTITPASGHTISAPPQGTRAAVGDQNGPTTEALYQDFTVPAGQSATLSFFLYYNNTYGSFVTLNTLDYNGNQQYRIDVMNTTAANESVAASDVLLKLFQTKPGDPVSMTPTLMKYDLSGFAGLTVRLRFAEAIGLNYFLGGVDDVCLSTTRTTITRTTPAGTNVRTSFGGVELNFPTVTAAGTTSLSQLDTAVQTAPPPGETFVGPAYDISTTATVATPITVCFYLPGITDANTFQHLRMLHKVAGVWVDEPSSRVNFSSKQLCAQVISLSPFAVGQNPLATTAAEGRISGRISDPNAAPIAGAVVKLTGAQNRKSITDANGDYRFDNVETDGFYTVSPWRPNYSFTPSERSFSQLGHQTEASFTAEPNGSDLNPLDTSEYFVRQHYLDFLGREPDEAGFNFWSDQISSCGNDVDCIERKRINVSAAYFLSTEFQHTGGLVNALYRMSFGRPPLYAEFVPDTGMIARDVIVGVEGWEQRLAANKRDFIAAFVQRTEFREVYDGLSNDRYVDELMARPGVNFTQSERDALVSGLTAGTLTRGQVLQRFAEDEHFVNAGRNQAFVMMQYFGYLRRDPDAAGYQFWLNKLNQFNGNFEQAEMVKAFIDSGEYRARFAK